MLIQGFMTAPSILKSICTSVRKELQAKNYKFGSYVPRINALMD
jgi:hypothetical protein